MAAPSQFVVKVGADTIALSAAEVAGNTVVLTLTGKIAHGTGGITITYSDPNAAANDRAAVQDRSGNDATSFTTQSVTNRVLAPTSAAAYGFTQRQEPQRLRLNTACLPMSVV